MTGRTNPSRRRLITFYCHLVKLNVDFTRRRVAACRNFFHVAEGEQKFSRRRLMLHGANAHLPTATTMKLCGKREVPFCHKSENMSKGKVLGGAMWERTHVLAAFCKLGQRRKIKKRLGIWTALTHAKLNICPLFLARQTRIPIYRACGECNAEEEEEEGD